jgi:endonuclease/exonuclease/phosphatase family metal-dependent hydrolase
MNLVIVSYNVLAARHLVPGRYPLSPVESLVSGPRFRRIGEQIASLHADLVCLQEMEHECFELLSRQLSGLGYEGFHALRSPTVGEGCALYAKSSSVRVHGRSRCDFADSPESGGASHRFAQLAELEAAGQSFVLANTHLQWDPPATPAMSHRGVAQARQLVAAINQITGPDGAAIICGDFNAGPESDVCRVFLEADYRAARPAGADEPTCQANGRLSEVDFVFHRGVHTAAPLPRAHLHVSTPMPGPEHPSDHLPVGAVFDGLSFTPLPTKTLKTESK